MATDIPSRSLNDGASIPILGYGAGTIWSKKSGDTTIIDRNLVETIKTAIRLGYRHLDGAEIYKNERELGIAIQESGVSRDKLFVTTKVLDNIDNIPAAMDASLEKLGLDYVDLYLIHSPFFAKSEQDLQNAWAEVEKLKRAGKARSIGVSNFIRPHLETVLKTAEITPAVNQIEYHPYLQHGELLSFHQQVGIVAEAYSTLSPITKAKGGPIDGEVSKLAGKYKVSEAVVLLRWVMEQGIVPISTSRNESRMAEYQQAAQIRLAEDEVQEISRLGEQKHFRTFWRDRISEDDRR